jgi:hypothetical protein
MEVQMIKWGYLCIALVAQISCLLCLQQTQPAGVKEFDFLRDCAEQIPGVLAVSIPKCGTHLLIKLLEELGFSLQHHRMATTVQMDYQNLRGLIGKKYFSTHLVAPQGPIHECIDYKTIYIYRDPRDQVVSFAYFMKKYPQWVDSNLPVDVLISKLIVDVPVYNTHQESDWNDPLLKNIGSIKNFYDLYKGWHEYPNIYITTFEKLVGAKGGGSDEEQYQEIYNIARYLNIAVSDIDIKAIQEHLFGGTETFRTGQIGSWRTHFTPDDKGMFKQVAGQMLIDLGYEQDLNW